MLQEETLARKFVRKGFWLYFFTILTGPLGYITKMVISRDLSVGEVGMIYGVISFVSLISIYNDLGFTESLNFFIPKHIIKREFGKAKYLLKLALFTQLVTSVSIATILFFLAPWLAEHYFHSPQVTEILQISGLFFIGINILQTTSILFSIAQDTKLQKLIEFLRMGFTAAGSVILFLGGNGNVLNYMWIWIGGVFFGMVFSAFFSYTKYYQSYFTGVKSEVDIQERRHFFRYAGATLLTANIGTVLSQIDMQLIIYFLGNEETGFYSNYLSLLNIPFIFVSPMLGFLFPVISELHGREDIFKMRLIHERFSLYLSILGIWIGVFMFQFGKELSLLFFGEAFETSGDILKFSAPFLIFNLLIQVNFQLLAGTGRIKDRAVILAIIIPINLILNLIFINLYDVYGAALAVGLSWIPLWYLSHRATSKYHSSFSYPPFLKNIFLAFTTFFILFLGLKYFPGASPFFTLSFAVFINLVIFSGGNYKMLLEIRRTIQENRK